MTLCTTGAFREASTFQRRAQKSPCFNFVCTTNIEAIIAIIPVFFTLLHDGILKNERKQFTFFEMFPPIPQCELLKYSQKY